MTWEPKIMPDDAPELAGSLVGSILGVEPVKPQPTLNDLPAKSSEQSDLCNAMVDVCLDTSHVYTEELMADVLDVVRDWLVPKGDKALRSTLISKGWVTGFNADTLVRLIQEYYSVQLTEQARIAREES